MTATHPLTSEFAVGRFLVCATSSPCVYAIRNESGNVVAVVRGLWAVLTWCEANE